MWSIPKTDWTAADYYNIADANRWRDNLQFIHDLAEELYGSIPIQPMYSDKTYASFPYASEMNNIENNLAAINSGTYNFDFGETQTFVPNGHTPSFDEVNRIEAATLRLKETLETQKGIKRHLAFRLGNSRALDVIRV